MSQGPGAEADLSSESAGPKLIYEPPPIHIPIHRSINTTNISSNDVSSDMSYGLVGLSGSASEASLSDPHDDLSPDMTLGHGQVKVYLQADRDKRDSYWHMHRMANGTEPRPGEKTLYWTQDQWNNCATTYDA
jgi:hypothetical protein